MLKSKGGTAVDQIKIGRFIAERRKAKGLTQMQLAEMLGITDRAVSKWETGKALPDASLMLALCEILGITVNDLLCGEVVRMENYNKEMENTLLEMVKKKEEADKRLLRTEMCIGVSATALLFIFIALAAFVPMWTWLKVTLIALGFVLFLAGCFSALRIEQMAGYYECQHCKHKYVPTFKAVTMAQHMGRTRYMTCPACQKKSWQKKVLNKED